MQAIFDFFTKELIESWQAFIFQVTSRSIPLLTEYFMLGMGLYMIFVIWNYQKSGINKSFSDFVKKSIGWLLIIGLGLNYGNYIRYIAEPVLSIPQELATILLGENADNGFKTLTSIADDFSKAEDVVWENTPSGLSNLGIVVSVGLILSLYKKNTSFKKTYDLQHTRG